MNRNGMRIVTTGWVLVILSILLDVIFMGLADWVILVWGIALVLSTLVWAYCWLPRETIKTKQTFIKDKHNL